MKILKIILLALASIVGLVLVVALLIKKEYALEREITINKPKAVVFDYIKYLKNQDNFSKWASIDTNMKKEYRGTDGTVGFVSGWDSENDEAGKGEQEIIKIIDGERIDYKLHFIKPMEGMADAYLATEATDANQTKVKWGFKSKMNYPMNILLPIMNIEKMVGDDFETGLKNLKTLLEK